MTPIETALISSVIGGGVTLSGKLFWDKISKKSETPPNGVIHKCSEHEKVAVNFMAIKKDLDNHVAQLKKGDKKMENFSIRLDSVQKDVRTIKGGVKVLLDMKGGSNGLVGNSD